MAVTPIHDDLRHDAERAAARLTDAHAGVDAARSEYHRAVRRLHLAGASLREIADALDLSHQRVHQIIESTGGVPDWRHRRRSAEPACSFCGATSDAVGHLIAGPAVYICDGCVRRREAGAVVGGRCDFCGRTDQPGSEQAADQVAHICADCLRFCHEVLAALPR